MEKNDELPEIPQYLAESERQELINELKNNIQPVDEVEKEKEDMKIMKKKITKTSLTEDIQTLQEALGYPIDEEKVLMGYTKEKLQKLYADLTTKGTQKLTQPEKAIEGATPMELQTENKQELSELMKKDGVATLYNMNMLMVEVCETASVFMKNKTGDIAILEGWQENVETQKERLLRVMERLYEKNAEVIDVVCSPAIQYAQIMLFSAGLTVNKNIKKKKMESINN
jgi:hypothetical protein